MRLFRKGRRAQGLITASIRRNKYLLIFPDDGEVPIDNLAAERAIRLFTIGRKN